MKYLPLSIVVALAAAVSLVVVSGALAATHSANRAVKVAVADSGLGRVLVDGRGRTLYLFEKDAQGKSMCNGQCTGFWPPLIAAGKPLSVTGAKASLVGTTKRKDGRLQVTYNHHPLYTFFEDTKKGQTNGEGLDDFGAKWYVVSPAGAKIEKSAASSSSTGQGSGSAANPTPGGYGY